ncbi:MAG: histone deacetylase family protein [Chloroflexi bacterium]|nr:histone deacetylase family protein [Chloroflexota bacterium]
MPETTAIIYSPRHREHQPRIEVLYGRHTPHPERPERVEAIRSAIAGSRWEHTVRGPSSFPIVIATSVHEPAYVAFLHEHADLAAEEGLDGEWFPYTWPRDRGLDLGTPISKHTVDLAWHSAECALTAAKVVRDGAPWSFSIGRPPGHHASVGAHGGYCYFNHAALVAQSFLDAPSMTGRTADRVAILDLDIHHGNGTQDIFYASDRVFYASIHGEPDWAYPPHSGFAGETGTGAGSGANYNQPLPIGTGWREYSHALDRAFDRMAQFDPSYLVVSQGFDTFSGDRWGGFELQAPDYARIGERLRTFGRPIVIILEGGYEPANIAAGTMSLLDGLA